MFFDGVEKRFVAFVGGNEQDLVLLPNLFGVVVPFFCRDFDLLELQVTSSNMQRRPTLPFIVQGMNNLSLS